LGFVISLREVGGACFLFSHRFFYFRLGEGVGFLLGFCAGFLRSGVLSSSSPVLGCKPTTQVGLFGSPCLFWRLRKKLNQIKSFESTVSGHPVLAAAADQVWVSGLLHIPKTKFMWCFLVVVEEICEAHHTCRSYFL
jgi:hypothetical protein